MNGALYYGKGGVISVVDVFDLLILATKEHPNKLLHIFCPLQGDETSNPLCASIIPDYILRINIITTSSLY